MSLFRITFAGKTDSYPSGIPHKSSKIYLRDFFRKFSENRSFKPLHRTYAARTSRGAIDNIWQWLLFRACSRGWRKQIPYHRCCHRFLFFWNWQ